MQTLSEKTKTVDFVQLAVTLGIQGSITGNEYRARCPLHDDRSPSFSMNIESGLWYCHRGCGSGSFIKLVEQVLGCGIQEAYDWVNNNGRATTIEQISSRINQWLNQPESPNHIPDSTGWLLRFNILDNKAMPLWFLERGFTWDTIINWDIRYDHVHDAVVVPVIWQNQIVGTVTRHTKPEFPKYQNSPNLPRSEILFGRLSEGKLSVILVEGLLDTIWLWQLGYNAAGLLNNSISNTQLQILRDLKYGEIILALDNDQGGIEGTQKVVKALTNAGWLLPQIKIIRFPQGKKDVQDCSVEEMDYLYENRKGYFFGS